MVYVAPTVAPLSFLRVGRQKSQSKIHPRTRQKWHRRHYTFPLGWVAVQHVACMFCFHIQPRVSFGFVAIRSQVLYSLLNLTCAIGGNWLLHETSPGKGVLSLRSCRIWGCLLLALPRGDLRVLPLLRGRLSGATESACGRCGASQFISGPAPLNTLTALPHISGPKGIT